MVSEEWKNEESLGRVATLPKTPSFFAPLWLDRSLTASTRKPRAVRWRFQIWTHSFFFLFFYFLFFFFFPSIFFRKCSLRYRGHIDTSGFHPKRKHWSDARSVSTQFWYNKSCPMRYYWTVPLVWHRPAQTRTTMTLTNPLVESSPVLKSQEQSCCDVNWCNYFQKLFSHSNTLFILLKKLRPDRRQIWNSIRGHNNNNNNKRKVKKKERKKEEKKTNEQTNNEKTKTETNEWTKERTKERTNKRTEERTNKQTNKRTNERKNEQTNNEKTKTETNERTNGQKNERTNKQTKEWTNERKRAWTTNYRKWERTNEWKIKRKKKKKRKKQEKEETKQRQASG